MKTKKDNNKCLCWYVFHLLNFFIYCKATLSLIIPFTQYFTKTIAQMCPQPGTGSAEKSEGETDNPFLALIEKMYPDAIPHGHKE